MTDMGRLVILLLFATLAGGCGSWGTMLRAKNTVENMPPSAVSLGGAPIYDLTGEASEQEWNLRFVILRDALGGLAYCVDRKIPEGMLAEIGKIPIVILPDSKLAKHGLWAATDLEVIFISAYQFTFQTVRHEMLHNYFFISQRWFFGDPFHLSPAFAESKCW